MNRKHTHSINAFVSKSKAVDPVVEIRSYSLAGKGLARVLIDVTHTEHSRKDHNLVANALRSRLNGKMAAVAGTFNVVESGEFTERLVGIVSVVRDVIPATPEAMKGFRATASNMFMDEEQDMWVLRKTEAGQILVRTTGIDDDLTLINLLDSVSSAGSITPSDMRRLSAVCSAVPESVQGGDFVTYVNADNTLSHGFVVATAEENQAVVLPTDDDEEQVIDKNSIVEVHDQAEFPVYEPTKEEQIDQVTAAARGLNLNQLLDYYRRVYARNPAFYQLFATRVRNHTFY